MEGTPSPLTGLVKTEDDVVQTLLVYPGVFLLVRTSPTFMESPQLPLLDLEGPESSRVSNIIVWLSYETARETRVFRTSAAWSWVSKA